MPDPSDIAAAKRLLVDNGWVVLRAGSYRKAQRMAEVLRSVEQERREGTERWARDCCERERRARDRVDAVLAAVVEAGADRKTVIDLLRKADSDV